MSSFLVPNDGIEDADGGEENVLPTFNGREGTIYLIDASIFEDVEQFRLCLDCIEADLLKSILINSRDLVSVVFYNTQNSPPPTEQLTDGEDTTTNVPSNCAVFIPLKPLSKQLIQYFKNFRESEELFNFAQTHGTSNGSSFSDALWLCSRLIMRCNYKLFFSKIILFTNNEQPHMPGTQEERQAHVRAKDLNDNNISVDVVPMIDNFNLEPFYKEFLSVVEDIDPEQYRYNEPVDKRFKLLNRIYRPNYRKSCLRHLNLELIDDVSMSCNVYSLARNTKKPNAVKMFRENKEVVVSKRSYYVAERNREDESEIVQHNVLTNKSYKSQVICGKDILFSPEEIIEMKSIQKPGLRLLGFKPLDQLKPRWMIKNCLFLYPDEEKIVGSTTLFRALWEKCLEKQRYALCSIAMRRSTSPKYVALVPQSAEEDGNDGFAIIYLPVATNIGALDSVMNPLPEPTPIQVSLLEKLCKKLKFTYHYESFSNPALQSFYANLEATVYDEEMKEINDLSIPNLEWQDKKIDPFLHSFDEEFGSEEAISSRGKRANDGEASGTRSKASKTDLSSNDVEEAIRNGRMEAVTVQHLKDFIRNRNAQHPPKAVKKNLFEIAQKLID